MATIRSHRGIVRQFFLGKTASYKNLISHNKVLYYNGALIASWRDSAIVFGTTNKRLFNYINLLAIRENKTAIRKYVLFSLELEDLKALKYWIKEQ